MDSAAVVGRFDEAFLEALLEAGEPAILQEKRRRAFDVYRMMAAPTGFDEEWRRTPPQLFPFAEFRPLPLLRRGGKAGTHPLDSEFDVVVAVGEGGIAIEDRSGLLAEGVCSVLTLEEAAASHPDLVRDHVGGRALPSDWDKFVALNHAFHNVGLLIQIPDGVVLDKGVLIRYAMATEGAALVPRVVVVAGSQSQATVAEVMESPDGLGMLCIPTHEVYVGAAARLKMIALQEWGDAACQIGSDMARVERDAQIDWITLNFGTRASKLKFGSDVAGEGSSAELDGLFFCDGDQHVDQKTLQIHSAANTYSRLLYKGAVQDRGHSVYQGVIQARPGAIKVDAYQTNNNLVLNDGAQADTIPGLLIDADDLKCSHGATIGNLDPDQLFYLRARGLSKAEARRILVLGFFDQVGDRIPYAYIRRRVHEIVNGKLGAAGEGPAS
jgi:Fe-S cluster assembly protein SufD